MDADTSEHEFSRIADKEASKLQSHNEYSFDAFNIQNSTTMGSDLPDYEDDEMPVRNSSPTWSVGIDDEDLYVSVGLCTWFTVNLIVDSIQCPGSSQANVQVNNVDTSLPQTGPSSTMQKAPDTRYALTLDCCPWYSFSLIIKVAESSSSQACGLGGYFFVRVGFNERSRRSQAFSNT